MSIRRKNPEKIRNHNETRRKIEKIENIIDNARPFMFLLFGFGLGVVIGLLAN